MALAQLQKHLQGIYELEVEHSIHDYLITSREMLDRRFQPALQARESLLVWQEDDDLLLSLYLDGNVLANLKENGAGIALHQGNIEDFCLALEGTSHFVYLMWNATYQRCVTRLEMEIQAEVDKFVILSKYTGHGHAACTTPAQVRNILFETAGYQEWLTEQELQRYRDANFYAGKYCRFLESRNFLAAGLEQGLLKELRRFYRLNLEDKLRRINCLY